MEIIRLDTCCHPKDGLKLSLVMEMSEAEIIELGYPSSNEMNGISESSFAIYSRNGICGDLIFKKMDIPTNSLDEEQRKLVSGADSMCRIEKILFCKPRLCILGYIRTNFFWRINCLRETIPNGIVVWFEVDSEKEAYRIKNAYPNVHNAAYNKLLLYAVVHTMDSLNFIRAFK